MGRYAKQSDRAMQNVTLKEKGKRYWGNVEETQRKISLQTVLWWADPKLSDSVSSYPEINWSKLLWKLDKIWQQKCSIKNKNSFLSKKFTKKLISRHNMQPDTLKIHTEIQRYSTIYDMNIRKKSM